MNFFKQINFVANFVTIEDVLLFRLYVFVLP